MKLDLHRILDLVIVIPTAIAILPLLLAVGLAVRLTSPGPAIYRGVRVGRAEQPFDQLKFRSMVADAEVRGTWWTDSSDPRITRIGAFLRKTSIDELPQLWNVIRGDMAIVGPRPASFPQLEEYTAEQRLQRASVRPGITGLAQARGRSGGGGSERKIALDLEYVRSRSVLLDIRIILETIPAVILQRGVN